jgi:hypothetical protein
VSGRHVRINVTLDGITLTSSEAWAARRASQPVRHVDWDDVLGATVQLSRKGRPVVRIAVLGEPTPEHHRDDPFSIKVPRNQVQSAHDLVQHINAEVDVRRRWRENADRRHG